MSGDFSWLTGWEVDDPGPTFGYSHRPWEQWPDTGGIRTHLVFRDSGLAEMTNGLLGAQYVRYVGDGSEDEDHGWHVHDLDWQAFTLLAGSMRQGTEQEGTTVMQAGDVACYPGLLWHREWDFSPDWEMIALRVPSKTKTISGRDSALPDRVSTMDPERRPVYTFERPESYRAGAGHEAAFEVRDLGTAAPTQGRIGMRMVRAATDGAETGWHDDEASTWFVVISGSAKLEVADEESVDLGRLAAVTIGPKMAHNISSASADFKIMELTIPAVYKTNRRDGTPAAAAA
jgi:quercetin dioxygenase-like cupin family protein